MIESQAASESSIEVATMDAWFSAKAAGLCGASTYRTPDGRELLATCVNSDEGYKWDDKVYVGKVVSGGRLGRTHGRMDRCSDGYSFAPRVPETDEDVFAFIEDNYSDPLIKTCLASIYKCRRGLGDAVLTAWLYAMVLVRWLEAQVKP
jgi:hypothetical protein